MNEPDKVIPSAAGIAPAEAPAAGPADEAVGAAYAGHAHAGHARAEAAPAHAHGPADAPAHAGHAHADATAHADAHPVLAGHGHADATAAHGDAHVGAVHSAPAHIDLGPVPPAEPLAHAVDLGQVGPVSPPPGVLAEAGALPSGPYRTLPRDEPIDFRQGTRKPWPVVGPAVRTFGVMLWAFVVAGQLTTSWLTGSPLDPRIAVGAVAVATLTAWGMALRQSHTVAPSSSARHLVARGFGIGALTLLLFAGSLVCAVMAGGSTSRNNDFFIAFALVVLATVAMLAGSRLTTPISPRRTHAQRWVMVLAWVAGAAVTLLAGADLALTG